MPAWKEFEKNVTTYLNDKIKISGISFISKGESDSNASDIEVYLNNKNIFSIECKYSPAQSSQFVVKEINNQFIFSEENRSSKDGASKIIQHMNTNYSSYSNSSNSCDLFCSKDLMFERVRKQLSAKSVFFISSSYISEYSISKPIVVDLISNIDKYFDISGKYRVKRSGTSYPNLSHLTGLNGYQKKGDKFYFYDPQNKMPNYPPNNSHLFLQAADGNGFRLIKKRSATSNKNVIFTLKLKNDIKFGGIDKLKNYIQTNFF
jgi:hypothetical protein